MNNLDIWLGGIYGGSSVLDLLDEVQGDDRVQPTDLWWMRIVPSGLLAYDWANLRVD